MGMTLLSEFVDRVAAAFGYVPVSEALSQSEFEVQLAALTTSAEERARLREAALVVGKLGVDPDDVAEALQAWERYKNRGAHDLRRVQRYIDQMIAELMGGA